MTAQVTDKLIVNGETLSMATEPLRDYLDNRTDIEFHSPHTACWRGYTGAWEIKNDRLYLTDINGFFTTAEERKNRQDSRHARNQNRNAMQPVFATTSPVFAEWFSGEIRATIGQMLEYVHMGYGSLYEKDLYMEIEKGVVIKSTEVDNRHKYENLSEKEKQQLALDRKYIF